MLVLTHKQLIISTLFYPQFPMKNFYLGLSCFLYINFIALSGMNSYTFANKFEVKLLVEVRV